jgi:hypothetical protein
VLDQGTTFRKNTYLALAIRASEYGDIKGQWLKAALMWTAGIGFILLVLWELSRRMLIM